MTGEVILESVIFVQFVVGEVRFISLRCSWWMCLIWNHILIFNSEIQSHGSLDDVFTCLLTGPYWKVRRYWVSIENCIELWYFVFTLRYGKSTIWRCISYRKKCWFSIAMLVYQRVYHFFCFHQLKVDQRWKSSKPYHFACFFVVQAQLEETKTGP